MGVTSLAKIISVVFHPLLMTTYLFAILSVFLPAIFLPIIPSWLFIFLVSLMTFLLPALNFLFFRVSGTVKDIQMTNRKDRILPFSFVTVLYVVVTVIFKWNFPVENIVRLMLIISALVVLSTLVTLIYKISVHSVGVWGVIGVLLPLNTASGGMLLYPIVGLIVIAGIIMTSRLQLDANNLREVMYGGAMGLVIGIGGVYLLF